MNLFKRKNMPTEKEMDELQTFNKYMQEKNKKRLRITMSYDGKSVQGVVTPHAFECAKVPKINLARMEVEQMFEELGLE